MRRMILLAAFLASCGEGQEELLVSHSFPFTAAGILANGEIGMASGNIAMWRLVATLPSFGGGADASLGASMFHPSPTELPVAITFEVSGLVFESRTYQFSVRGTAARVS